MKTPKLNAENLNFPIIDRCCYLNHAAICPWPAPVADAVATFAEENREHGPLNYARWMKVEQELRECLARLIHAASPDDIALLKNTTEGLNAVAQGVDWRRGDRVVIPDEEFPSNRLPWDALADRDVVVETVSLAVDSPEDALISAMDKPGTRLLSVSGVQYASGRRLDLAVLGRACRERGILFCVDAIQQLGAIDTDVRSIGADFVVADAHKWLLGPEGIAVFWSRPQAREQLRLRQFGWRMVDDPYQFARDHWTPSSTARRFEAGSPNMIGIFAFRAAAGLLLDEGMAEIEQRVTGAADTLIQGLESITGVARVLPERRDFHAGIVHFTPESADPDELHRELAQRRIITAKRGPGIRLSPHFYTPRRQLDTAIETIDALLLRGRSS